MATERVGLPHEPNRVIIGFTESPEGTPVIGMTLNSREWTLLATMPALTADRLRVQLKEEFGADSLPGLPLNWRESLRRRELVLFEDIGRGNNPVGVFVPAEKFDELLKPLSH